MSQAAGGVASGVSPILIEASNAAEFSEVLLSVELGPPEFESCKESVGSAYCSVVEAIVSSA